MLLDELGFELVYDFLSVDVASSILNETDAELLKHRGGGIRNAEKKFPAIRNLISSSNMRGQAEKYLPGPAMFVRAILFDKSAENNWLVAWHQDKTVAVSRKFDSEGWVPWSVKDGTLHVQPPLDVLEQMVTFRIHLDACNQQNGCLKVIPRSHTLGVLSQDQIGVFDKSDASVLVEAPVLSALVMRPHLLHASSKGLEPSRRRVLHIEYSSYELQNGVCWA